MVNRDRKTDFLKSASIENYIINEENTIWYEASMVQKRMYIIHERNPEKLHYNLTLAITFRGYFNENKFISAFKTSIDRHGMLRAGFKELDDKIMYSIRENQILNLEIKDAHYKEGTDPSAYIKDNIKEFIRPYHLEKDTLYRARLIRFDIDTNILFLDFHHIVCDGGSTRIFLKDLQDAYHSTGAPSDQFDFPAYFSKQKEFMKSNEYKQKRLFWEELLNENEYQCGILADQPEDKNKIYPSKGKNFTVHEKAGIDRICQTADCSRFSFFVAAINLTLSVLTFQKDIAIGTVSAGRREEALKAAVGMFVYTFPLCNQVDYQMSIKDFIRSIQYGIKAALNNSGVQYETLLDVSRDRKHSLFDISVRYQASYENALQMDKLDCQVQEVLPVDCASNFGIFIDECRERFEITISYAKEIYKDETVERFIKLFQHLISVFQEEYDIRLKDIEVIGAEDKRRVLEQFNATDRKYSQYKTAAELFEAQVYAAPENIAVVCKTEQQTYGMLNRRANRLAYRLREMGIAPDDLVVIIADKSMEMLEAILGVWKAGGAYVPIDPMYPPDRITYMLKDCNPKAVLTYGETASKLVKHTEIPVLRLEDPKLWVGKDINLTGRNRSKDLAYCIYTSGTTGRPKGVLVEHWGICNLREYFIEVQAMGREDRVLQFASISFDAMISEICMSVLSGGTLYIPEEDIRKDTASLEVFLEENKITAAVLPPQLAVRLDLKGVKKIITAGAAAIKECVMKNAGIRRYSNDYGPTEATVCATHWECRDIGQLADNIPIGRPINNVRTYVLNGMQLCGIGMPGELCIGGNGLARGYLNEPILTRKKFIHNPFGEGRLFRTGDLAKWLPDGNIEFLGRIDDQVKIRGFRIEPGEIESVLRNIDCIRDAAVVAKQDASGELGLYAYLVSDEAVMITQIREILASKLPEYMIPAYILQIDEIPMTRNGKRNNKLLPSIQIKSQNEYIAPQNPIEEDIICIWKELLNTDTVSTLDQFLELGGHSLLANRMLIRINQMYGIHLKLGDILREGLTVRKLSELVENQLINSLSENEIEELLKELAITDSKP